MRIPEGIFEQIASAYREMAKKVKYRPSAPSDGMGNITVPIEQLDLEKEAAQYARDWWKEEDYCLFTIGSPHYPMRRAIIYAVEAAKLMCSGIRGRPYAVKLLHLALNELATAPKKAA